MVEVEENKPIPYQLQKQRPNHLHGTKSDFEDFL